MTMDDTSTKIRPSRFVVIIEYGSLNRHRHAYGVFRSFMQADRAARAIQSRIGNRAVTIAYVLPIETVESLPWDTHRVGGPTTMDECWYEFRAYNEQVLYGYGPSFAADLCVDHLNKGRQINHFAAYRVPDDLAIELGLERRDDTFVLLDELEEYTR
jgi:hypothetical protein